MMLKKILLLSFSFILANHVISKEVSESVQADSSAVNLESADGDNKRIKSVINKPLRWKCKWCEFDQAYQESWEIALGVEHYSNDSPHFMRDTGVNKKGANVMARFIGESLNQSGRYWKVLADNSEHRQTSLALVYGQRAEYELALKYSNFNRYNSIVQSPFILNATDVLSLPDNWVFANNSSDMVALNGNLNNVILDSNRTAFDLSAVWLPTDNRPKFQLTYQNLTNKGTKGRGAAIGFDNAFATNTTVLPLSYEYKTEQIDANIAYRWSLGHLNVGILSSIFSNKTLQTIWQNPFISESLQGAFFLNEPNNQFNQFYISSRYQFLPRSHVSSYLAYGRMTQNEIFSAYSINNSIISDALPTASLNGQVTTLVADIKISHWLSKKWRMNSSFTVDKKDNQTSSNLYNYIVNDTALSYTARLNIPYSYTRNKVKLNTNYRLPDRSKLSLGIIADRYDRTYQSRKTTDETAFWVDYKRELLEGVDVHVKYQTSDRKGDAQREIEALQSNENPLMQKYYLADRQRENLQFDIGVYIFDTVDLSLGMDLGNDDYNNSSLGLITSDYQNYSLDLTWVLDESFSVHAFLSLENYDSLQAGSQLYSTADWFNEVKDRTKTIGSGLQYSIWEGELQIGADLIYSESQEINQLSSDILQLSLASLPEVNIMLASFELSLTYQINESTQLQSKFQREIYEDDLISDFSLSANSINDVLLFERADLNRNVNYFSVLIAYQF